MMKLVLAPVSTIRKVLRKGFPQEAMPSPKPKQKVDQPEAVLRRFRICFLCLQETMHHVPMSDDLEPGLGSYRAKIIWKYFRSELNFEQTDMAGQYVCLRCWLKIDEFYQLHKEIKGAHARKGHLGSMPVRHEHKEAEEPAEIVENSQDFPEEREVKTEPHAESDSCVEVIKIDPPGEDDLPQIDEDYEAYEILELEPVKMPPPPRKKPRQLKCTIRCRWCAQRFDGFGQMQTHCAGVHRIVGHVTCCGSKFTEEAVLVEHMREVHQKGGKRR